MPLQSKQQVKALFAKGRGDIVKRWQQEAPVDLKSLPIRKAASRRVAGVGVQSDDDGSGPRNG